MSTAATESNTFGSLGPMLLARKGTAKPAMRAQLTPSDRVAKLDDKFPTDDFDDLAASQSDLGWDDMGLDSDQDDDTASVVGPEIGPEFGPEFGVEAGYEVGSDEADSDVDNAIVRLPVANHAASRAAEVVTLTKDKANAAPAPARRAAVEQGRRAAFTLRLNAERHLKLRLAATIHECSAQKLVTKALDKFLDEISELESIAAHVAGNNNKV